MCSISLYSVESDRHGLEREAWGSRSSGSHRRFALRDFATFRAKDRNAYQPDHRRSVSMRSAGEPEMQKPDTRPSEQPEGVLLSGGEGSASSDPW
ncbi:hypothetical protein BDV06DRAFT_18904 [Aspergillus oleicola]